MPRREVDPMTTEGSDVAEEEGCDEPGLDRYVCLLRRRDLMVTSPRVRILQFLDHSDDHPTADAIHSIEKYPSLNCSNADKVSFCWCTEISPLLAIRR